MARPNRPRMIGSERALARRVQWEREQRGMSYDGLASRMTQAGCAIQGSALFKIEKGNPPRRITVDELVALAKVFETDVAELLRPLGAVLNEEIEQVAANEEAAWTSMYEAIRTCREATREHLTLYRRATIEGNESLIEALDAWEKEWRARIREGVKASKPGGLAGAVQDYLAEAAARSPEQQAQHEFEERLHEAIDELCSVIDAITREEVWGTSNG